VRGSHRLSAEAAPHPASPRTRGRAARKTGWCAVSRRTTYAMRELHGSREIGWRVARGGDRWILELPDGDRRGGWRIGRAHGQPSRHGPPEQPARRRNESSERDAWRTGSITRQRHRPCQRRRSTLAITREVPNDAVFRRRGLGLWQGRRSMLQRRCQKRRSRSRS
jgi:hypothetical protein